MNAATPTATYPLSLHDALPIFGDFLRAMITADYDLVPGDRHGYREALIEAFRLRGIDRKSTRLNSSHLVISYAVFCLKKKRSTNKGCEDNFTVQATGSSIDRI